MVGEETGSFPAGSRRPPTTTHAPCLSPCPRATLKLSPVSPTTVPCPHTHHRPESSLWGLAGTPHQPGRATDPQEPPCAQCQLRAICGDDQRWGSGYKIIRQGALCSSQGHRRSGHIQNQGSGKWTMGPSSPRVLPASPECSPRMWATLPHDEILAHGEGKAGFVLHCVPQAFNSTQEPRLGVPRRGEPGRQGWARHCPVLKEISVWSRQGRTQ